MAAGTGSRLAPLTDTSPKCLVKLNGISMLERLVESLKSNGFMRLVIVVGHHEQIIRDFLGTRSGNMEISYVLSPRYKTTNNIYSLWLARNLINEPFLLLESDVVFQKHLLKNMLWPDRIAIGRRKSWMNGTTVTIDSHQEVDAFLAGSLYNPALKQYKTVNFYSLSVNSWNLVKARLEKHISSNQLNGYYETVFSELVDEGSLHFKPVLFGAKRWYEIDNLHDLHEAEKIFPNKTPAPVSNLLKQTFHKIVQSVPAPKMPPRLSPEKVKVPIVAFDGVN